MDPFGAIPPPFPTLERKESAEPASRKASDNTASLSLNDDEPAPFQTPEERLAAALSLKDEGTRKLKEGDIVGATAAYKDGLKKLDEDNLTSEGEDEVSSEMSRRQRETRQALNLNLALCNIKAEAWIEAIHAASAVLKKDRKNVKALYRRGLARSRVGFLDEARDDLTSAYEIDPKNVDARRELQTVRQKLAEARARDKKTFSGLFARAGGLYEDRERALQEQKAKEEEARRKEMEEFERINKERESRGGVPFESFEVWKQAKEEEAKKKEEPAKKKREEKNAAAPLRGSVSKPVDLDEEDQKILEETKKMGRFFLGGFSLVKRILLLQSPRPRGRCRSHFREAGSYKN